LDPPAPDDTTNRTPLPLRVALLAEDPLSRAGLTALLLEGGVGVDAGSSAPADVALWDADDGGPVPERSEPLLAIVGDLGRSSELIAAGATGVLSRGTGARRLTAAVTALASGLAVLPASARTALLAPTFEGDASLPLDPLTAREREVLELLADGLTNAAIGERLDLGLSTVKFHMEALLSKFAASTRTEVVVRAIRSGELLV
jgi:DNA-binding CsgD family transcriptional regulator